MPMSEYIRDLRARIGTRVLGVPTVAILTFDERRRALLVRHVEGNEWTTPGGMIEPYETPSEAAAREMWEETGLHVELTRIVGVFGGTVCSSVYANGDQVAWISTVFEGRVVGGALEADGEETLEVRYFARDELAHVRCKPHLALFLDAAYRGIPEAQFQPTTWTPPSPA